MKITEKLREQWRVSAIEAARKFRPLFKAAKHRWGTEYIDKDGMRLTYVPRVHDIVRRLSELTEEVAKDLEEIEEIPECGIMRGCGGLVVEAEGDNNVILLHYKYEATEFGWLPEHEEECGGDE